MFCSFGSFNLTYAALYLPGEPAFITTELHYLFASFPHLARNEFFETHS